MGSTCGEKIGRKPPCHWDRPVPESSAVFASPTPLITRTESIHHGAQTLSTSAFPTPLAAGNVYRTVPYRTSRAVVSNRNRCILHMKY
eukprot:jgi/Psemu1/303088/fgenesh1_kg.91_\